MWFGATVRSPHAAARILGIDAAAVSSGAVVVTAADLPGPNVLRLIADDWPCLARGEVRHVGEPVALVAAPTKAEARAAAAALRVEYEPLEPVLGLDQALAQGARELASCNVDHGDVEAALGGAARVVEGRLRDRAPGARLHRAQRHDRRAPCGGRVARADRLDAVPLLRARRPGAPVRLRRRRHPRAPGRHRRRLRRQGGLPRHGRGPRRAAGAPRRPAGGSWSTSATRTWSPAPSATPRG